MPHNFEFCICIQSAHWLPGALEAEIEMNNNQVEATLSWPIPVSSPIVDVQLRIKQIDLCSRFD